MRANDMMAVWHILIVGIIAIISVYLYNDFLAGKKFAGMTLGRA